MLNFPTWKVSLILVTIIGGICLAFPNLLSESTRNTIPGPLPSNTVNLGLDLRGGVYLLLEIDPAEAEENRLNEISRDIQRELIKNPKINFLGRAVIDNAVRVRIRDINQVDEAMSRIRSLGNQVDLAVVNPLISTQSGYDIKHVGDGVLEIRLTDSAKRELSKDTLERVMEVVRRRVDELGTREPSIQRQGENRIVIEVAGEDDPSRLKRVIGKTAFLTFNLVEPRSDLLNAAINGRVRPGWKLLETDNPGEPYLLVENAPIVTGVDLVQAAQSFDENGAPSVNFSFNTRGGTLFGRASTANVGQRFAIVLDDRVVSAPRINQPITGGSGIITGSFTVDSANELALVLRAGALPVDVTFVGENTVSATLGEDSIRSGSLSMIFGLVLVAVFMFLVYGRMGAFAVTSLIINIILIVGVLSLLQATLTLPGIAGIILTIGMAVDANVLVFERIREETRAGRSPITALDAGYSRALSAILDANFTTLIAAIVLYMLGSGPVKGFAITLIIGIITSVFSAFVFTRWLSVLWLKIKRNSVIGDWALLFRYLTSETKIGFMKIRRMAIGGSIAALLATIVAVPVLGLNLGIDFKGGLAVEVETPEPVDIAQIRSLLSSLNMGQVQVQEFGTDNVVMIRTPAISEEDINLESGLSDAQKARAIEVAQQARADLVSETLKTKISGLEIRHIESLGPKVSSELYRAGITALITALTLMLLYIWMRFEWQYSIGAVIALVHDVLLTVGMFALTQLEFNLSTIAALLTIIGYSMNDTVVVYDRVRENLRKYKKMPLVDLLNMTLNQTLSRTILTSGTTLLALISIFILGGEALRGFSFAMIWGVLIGTYSSIVVASTVLLYTRVREAKTHSSDAFSMP